MWRYPPLPHKNPFDLEITANYSPSIYRGIDMKSPEEDVGHRQMFARFICLSFSLDPSFLAFGPLF